MVQTMEFVMMTIRSHDQYNTTIYGLDDRYRGIKGNRRIIMMNPDDMLPHLVKSMNDTARNTLGPVTYTINS